MAVAQSIVCENCETPLAKLDEAFVWLDRPVCKRCFKRLSATRSVKYRGLWMPLAIGAIVLALAACVALAVVLSRSRGANTAAASTGSLGRSTTTMTAATATMQAGRLVAGPTGGEALRRRLSGTKWEWSNETIVLREDGLVEQPNWAGRGLETRWAAFDEHTVVFFITKGRNKDRFATLHFNEDLTRWDGTSFEGKRSQDNRRIPDEPK
jgi:hypothetical protein